MSNIKIFTQHDNKDVEAGNLSQQTSADTSIDMHAVETEEEDVRRSVLHKEEEHKKRRTELEADNEARARQFAGIFGKNKKYIIGFNAFNERSSEYTTGPPFDYSEEEEGRNAFVLKVMILVFISLAITCAVILAVAIVEPLHHFFSRYHVFIWIPTIIGMVIMSYVIPFSACARTPPTNYLCLLIAVVLQTLFTASVTAFYQTHIILQAFLATVGVVAICVILACTSFDFTKWILYVIAIGAALMILAVIILVTTLVFNIHSKPLMIGLSIIFTLYNVVVLIIELQMVLGGKSVELSEYDYVLGAYLIYSSIIHIFMNLLQIMNN